MSTPSLGNCPFCGFGPIQSGLFICRGCHARIRYVRTRWIFLIRLAALVGLVGYFAGAILMAPIIGSIAGRQWGWWILFACLPLGMFIAVGLANYIVNRIEEKNIAAGRGRFYHRWWC